LQVPFDRDANLSFLVVDHDVVGLDITMHDAFAVAEVQRLEQFIDIIPDIVVYKTRIKRPKVGVVHILEHKARRLALAVANHVQQRDNVGAPR
jgi:hypothetical protein